jgi:hypothetical protein
VRALAVLALLASAATASTAVAQGTKAPATKQDTKAPATKAPATKAPAPATKTVAPAGTKAGAQTGTKAGAQTGTKAGAPTTGTKAGAPGGRALTVAPEAARPVRVTLPVIMREVFEYEPAGRRDPFFSLLTTAELRPTITDLKLVGILYDESGRRPVAIMRDVQNNTQYRVTTGMTLGRMRVSSIKRRAVIFTIEEFGLNRMDTLVLGDTSKLRIR